VLLRALLEVFDLQLVRLPHSRQQCMTQSAFARQALTSLYIAFAEHGAGLSGCSAQY
jgi:hypothetical protein